MTQSRRTIKPILRKQLGVKVDAALWMQLKIQALKEGRDAFQLLEDAIKQYLETHGNE